MDINDHCPVYTISPSRDFLAELAKGIWERCNKDQSTLARVQVFLPTRRSCRNLQQAFLKVFNGKTMMLPRMTALGDLDEEEMALLSRDKDFLDSALSIPQAISTLRRQFILTEMILKQEADPEFFAADAFIMAGELGRFIDDFITEGILYEDLVDIVPDHLSEHWKKTLNFLQIVLKEWPLYLEQNKMLDPSERRNQLLRTQAKIWAQNPPKNKVFIAGVTGTIPAAADFIKTVLKLPSGTIILPGVDLILDHESWEQITETHPQYGLKKLLDYLNIERSSIEHWISNDLKENEQQKILSEVMRPAQTTDQWDKINQIESDAFPNLYLINCDHEQEEAEVASIILRQALEDPTKTASLVTPDRTFARRVSSIMKRWGVDINDSSGVPLLYTRAGSWLFLTSKLFIQEPSSLDILSVLKHPFFRQAVGQDQWERFINYFEKKKMRGLKTYRTLEDLYDFYRQTAQKNSSSNISFFWESLLEKRKEIENSKSFYDRLLLHVGWAEKVLVHDESLETRLWRNEDGEQAAVFIHQLMEVASSFAEDHFTQKYSSYDDLLKIMLQNVSVRPKFGMHPRLSILGLMEARLIKTDVTIMAGLNEGVWPLEQKTDPFFSRKMALQCGLPTSDKPIGMAAHDFVEKCSGSHVYMLRAKKNGGAPTVPARWIKRFETVLTKMGSAFKQAEEIKKWANILDCPKDQEKKTVGIVPLPRPSLERRPTSFSVSSIEKLRRDPYAFYAHKILGLRKLDPIDKEPDHLDKGNFIHKILEDFVKKHLYDLPDHSEDILITIASSYLPQYCPVESQQLFWRERFKKIAHSFIQHEKKARINSFPVVIEKRGEMSIDIHEKKFIIHAKVDRINLKKDKRSAIIIDYKTGSIPSKKSVRQGFSPQLPIEALIVRSRGFDFLKSDCTIDDLEYWSLKGNNDDKIISVMDEGLLEETWQGIHRFLSFYDQEDTAYQVSPIPEMNLTHNDYEHLSRIKEWENKV